MDASEKSPLYKALKEALSRWVDDVGLSAHTLVEGRNERGTHGEVFQLTSYSSKNFKKKNWVNLLFFLKKYKT